MQVGLLHKLVMLVVLSLLVSGEDKLRLSQNESSISVVVGMKKKLGVSEMKKNHQRVAHSLDEFFWSKRRVPNASDPLHNR